MINLDFCTVVKVDNGYDGEMGGYNMIFGDRIVYCSTLFEAFFKACWVENIVFTSNTRFKIMTRDAEGVEQ